MDEDRVAPAASPVAVLVSEAHEHSGARPSLVQSLLRFCVTGVCSLGADFAVLYSLYKGAGTPLSVATTVGLVAAVIVNYTLNRNWTFQAQAGHGTTVGPYMFMVGLNFATTLVIVDGLTHAGLYFLWSKVVAVAVNASLNFLAARFWVFKH